MMKRDLNTLLQELALNRYDRAKNYVHEVEKKDKLKGIFFNAILLYHQGKLDKSLSLIKKLIDLKWENSDLYHYLSRIYFQWNNLEEALKYIDLAISNEEPNPEFIIYKAKILKEKGNIEESLKCLKSVDESCCANSSYFLTMAEILKEKGAIDEAINYYLKALKQSPFSNYPLLQISKICLNNNKLEQGMELLESFLEYPLLADAEIYYELARYYILLNKKEKLKSLLQQIYKITQDSIKDLLQISKIFLVIGDFENAEKFLKIASEQKGDKRDLSTIYLLKAILFQYKKRFRKAKENFQKSLDFNPNNLTTLLNYAFFLIYFMEDQYIPTAEQLLERAKKLSPENEYVKINNILLLIKKKKYEQARKEFKEFIIKNRLI